MSRCGKRSDGASAGGLAASSLVLLLLLTVDFADALIKFSKPPEPRVVVVGTALGRSSVNPWSNGVLLWKTPTVRPGDFLVFRWFGQMRDVQQFPDLASYRTCDFTRADPVGRRRFFGLDLYLVRKVERRTTLYFGSSVGKQCKRGIKVEVDVR